MSPLKSKAQLRRFGELVKQGQMSQEEFDKWVKDTPNLNSLPERVTPQAPTGLDRLKKVKVIK